MKNFIKNFLLEQDNNLVSISPDEYLELLDNIGGIAERITKLKPYRGKGIVITGSIDLSNKKNIGPLTGVVRVMGRLDISNSNVPTTEGITVDGYTSNYGSTMWRIKAQKELDDKFEFLNEMREDDAWNVENGEDISERTEAVYKYLKSNRKLDLYDNEKGEEELEDKYFIYPNGGQFEWLGSSGSFDPDTYEVYTEDQADSAAKDRIQDMIDDVGQDAFSEWVWESAIDNNYWYRWLTEFYSEYISDNPESFDIPLELSNEQKNQVSKLANSIEVLRDKIKNDDITDEERNKIIVKVEGLKEIINEINEDPQGEYDSDLIDKEVDERVNEWRDDLMGFVSEFGYDKSFIVDFVDIDKLTDKVISSDGYGSVLNSYDGDYESYNIGGTEYYVMRSS